MATLIGQKAMNLVISHLDEVRDEVHNKAKEVEELASANLEAARSSTHWHKIHGADGLTKTSVTKGDVDSFVNLEAPNAMAIEFGHHPSGVFAGTDTKSPEGLYILGKASGLAG